MRAQKAATKNQIIMSILFPKVNKPRSWDYRPIYYDKDKEERAERRQSMRNSGSDSYRTSLHRGSFRESHEANMPNNIRTRRASRLGFWVALLALLLFFVYLLTQML